MNALPQEQMDIFIKHIDKVPDQCLVDMAFFLRLMILIDPKKVAPQEKELGHAIANEMLRRVPASTIA